MSIFKSPPDMNIFINHHYSGKIINFVYLIILGGLWTSVGKIVKCIIKFELNF